MSLKAGQILSEPARQPRFGGVSPPTVCSSVWGNLYTWLVSESPICFGPDLSVQVRVIASSDRRYRKPWWLWSPINTAGSGCLGLGGVGSTLQDTDLGVDWPRVRGVEAFGSSGLRSNLLRSGTRGMRGSRRDTWMGSFQRAAAAWPSRGDALGTSRIG